MMRYKSTLILAALFLAACGNVPVSPVNPTPGGPGANKPAAQAATLYKVDGEGFVHNWVVLDPIVLGDANDQSEDTIKPMFAKEYFKDQLKVQPKPGDKVTVAAKPLVWREVKLDATTSQIDLVQFAQDHSMDTESVLFWGVAYVVADAEIKNVSLAIGSDDSSVWWLNGQEVVRVYEARGVAADDNVTDPITLKKGVNELRFAVINGPGQSGACARFLDANKKPVTNLSVKVDPAGK